MTSLSVIRAQVNNKIYRYVFIVVAFTILYIQNKIPKKINNFNKTKNYFSQLITIKCSLNSSNYKRTHITIKKKKKCNKPQLKKKLKTLNDILVIKIK